MLVLKESVGSVNIIGQPSVETVSQTRITNIVNTSSTYGTVTLASAPTFPSGGFTTNATVFKWQKEYMDLVGSFSTHRDATTRITFRVTDGSQGANVWLDDFKTVGNYLNDAVADSFDTATGIGTYTSATDKLNQYAQYRAIQTSWDTNVSSQLTSASFNYTNNTSPGSPPSPPLPIWQPMLH